MSASTLRAQELTAAEAEAAAAEAEAVTATAEAATEAAEAVDADSTHLHIIKFFCRPKG